MYGQDSKRMNSKRDWQNYTEGRLITGHLLSYLEDRFRSRKGHMRTVTLTLMLIVPLVGSVADANAQTDFEKTQNLTTCLSGRYPILCKRQWLTPEELKKVDAAERRHNLGTCLTGR